MTGTILIVDDEEEICAVLTEYLEGRGFTVFQANELSQARSHLKRGLHPDLVLLDVVLGDGDGISFLRELRNSVAPREVPVIIMSAHRTTSIDKASGLEVGADDYVAKPFDMREIALRIDRLIRQNRKKRPDPHQKPEPVPSSEDVASVLKGLLKKDGFPSAPGPDRPKTPSNNDMASSLDSLLEQGPDDEASEEEQRPEDPTLKELALGFLQLLVEPRKFIQAADEGRLAMIGYISLSLAGIFMGIQQGFENKTLSDGFINALMYSAIYWIGAATMAWVIQWIMGLRHKPMKFRAPMTVVAAGFAPLAFAAVLGAIYVAAAKGRAGEFTVGPLLLFPTQGASKYLGFLFRRMDIFEFWSIWIAARTLHRFAGGRQRSAYRWAFGTWLVLIAVGTVVAGLLL